MPPSEVPPASQPSDSPPNGAASGDLVAEKAALRKRLLAARAALVADLDRAAAAEALAAAVMASGRLEGAGCVSAFWPMGAEVDLRPLMTRLDAQGKDIALPVVAGRDRPLVFRRWRPGDALVSGGFGTSIPAPEAEVLVPEVLLVPLLAFDRQGYRLGYGGGFYDRTLEALRHEGRQVRAIGVAFAGQESEAVPREAHDEPLDAVFTEKGEIMLHPQATRATTRRQGAD